MPRLSGLEYILVNEMIPKYDIAIPDEVAISYE